MNIEGKNPVKEALFSEIKINKVIIQEGIHDTEEIIKQANKRKIQIKFAKKNYLDEISITQKHQGLIALIDEYAYSSVEDIIEYAKEKNEKLFLLILDGIEDPHNLGSVIRTAECAGVHGIIIPKHRAVNVNETVMRVSAGAVNHMKVAMVTNINDTIRQLSDEFVNIYCADMDGENLFDCRFDGDIAIVVGGESNGVKPLTRKLCDKIISIPQFGKVNSLNASVACAVVVYEAVRKRIN